MVDGDISRDDTIRIDGLSFRWVVDAIVPGSPYGTPRLRVSRTWREGRSIRTTRSSSAARTLPGPTWSARATPTTMEPTSCSGE